MIPLQLDQMTKFVPDLLPSAQSLLDITERSQGDFNSLRNHRMLPTAETIPAASPVSVKGEMEGHGQRRLRSFICLVPLWPAEVVF
ncbi:unnamed protein product [Chondrus crispus]|uniref:Uncharacterized protein n=1 Tax=Chondrus crispus TaxID=2769 RepID=R7QPR5_CHOCR|nr:unnamed protein product [Chondrus crispus]CDF39385.1 unnamed protein product [Chondrus crispus]|eukprot:XP_005719296.1 unnamed protein product [Chondrus crispus]